MLAQPVNRLLHQDQLEAVINLLLGGKVTVLRIIARTGKYRQGTSWVYFESIAGRRATFVSFDDLLEAFFAYLETIQIMFLSLNARVAISKVIWQLADVGDAVWCDRYGWVEIVDRDWIKGVPRWWIAIGEQLEKIMPCEAQIL